MRSNVRPRSLFLLGSAATLGAVLAFAVVAFAGGAGSGQDLRPLGERRPAAESFSAFQRAREAGDALTPTAAALLSSLVADAPRSELDPGALLVDDSRRIVGPLGEVAFVVPTDKEQVCFAFPASGEAGCSNGAALAADGIELQLLDEDGLGHGAPTVLRGFAAANVKAVSVSSSDGRTTTSSITRGMFLLRSSAAPDSVVVSFADGTERRLSISPPKD